MNNDTALQLWKELYEWTGDNPYEIDKMEETLTCYFCGSNERDEHEPGCIWVRVLELLKKEGLL